jgi:hypothetical protein
MAGVTLIKHRRKTFKYSKLNLWKKSSMHTEIIVFNAYIKQKPTGFKTPSGRITDKFEPTSKISNEVNDKAETGNP